MRSAIAPACAAAIASLLASCADAVPVAFDAFPAELPAGSGPPVQPPWASDFKGSVTIQVQDSARGQNVTMQGYMYASQQTKKMRANLLQSVVQGGHLVTAAVALIQDDARGTQTLVHPLPGVDKVACVTSKSAALLGAAAVGPQGTTFGGYTFLGATLVAVYISAAPGQTPLGVFIDPFNAQPVGLMGKNIKGQTVIAVFTTDFTSVPVGLPAAEFVVPANLDCKPGPVPPDTTAAEAMAFLAGLHR
jgi:hypothetical protein